MNKITFLFLPVLVIALLFGANICAAQENLTPQKGVARGSTHIQGYSFDGDEGTLTFYNVGQLLADSRYSRAVLSVNDASWTGTFSGGPEGTAHFVTDLGAEINIKLSGGRDFSLDTPGAWIHLTVTDPSIFEPAEQEPADEETPPEEEAAPDEPLVDSRVRMSSINGQLEIACPPNLDSWDVMKMGRPIYVNCHLRTGEDSDAVISFPDMTTFKMKPESELVIDVPPEKDSKLKLLAGNIWVNVKKMIKDGTMEVHGSQAVAGIKGTIFIMTENGSVTGLKVIEGTVNYRSSISGESKEVNAGESLEADKDGLKEVQKFDIEAEKGLWGETGVQTEGEDVAAANPATRAAQEPAGKEPGKNDGVLSYELFWPIAAGITALIAVLITIIVRKKGTKK
jgi:hypothetical protein